MKLDVLDLSFFIILGLKHKREFSFPLKYVEFCHKWLLETPGPLAPLRKAQRWYRVFDDDKRETED